MGFPVGYSELLLPKLLLQLVFFLGFLRQIISSAFDAVGLGDLLDSETPWPDPQPQIPYHTTGCQPQEFHSVSAMLIQEILPVVRFEDLLTEEGEIDRRPMGDGCAVCLYEIEPWEEVRRLSNCRHVFHRCCLDRWMQHDHRTCPLCRTPLIPEEMQEAFNLRLWAAAGIPDSDSGDFPSPSSASSFPPLSPALL
ncbi:E3 ubiquitin-protein ligase RHA1B-like [Phalaenopsis equestris]|uniref:E3 ubiquitin-protein ligase RHA1B-like n=1 Tax=Phalaenopsis equestris TaxID=78828 RepID=UPI0009E2DF8F|nr:E3 ubiquitin-protein ligase RHA1B-like [Phalaenopsis equestris]